MAAVVARPSGTLRAAAYHACSLAALTRPVPRARATVVMMPPPIAPWAMASTSETSGKTGATPARASTPSRDTKYTSSSPIRTWMVMTAALGIASRMIMGAIGFASSMWVRGSRLAGWPPGCRFASWCWRPSMAGAASPENPTAASRESPLHLSASESSAVRHEIAQEACMAGAPSRSLTTTPGKAADRTIRFDNAC